jgi:metal-dependent amidase/aminoacylase/carboxypeptidase family protein
LQKIGSRATDPATPFVLTVGQIEGGTARNVIADRVKLVCTARTLSRPFGKKIMGLVRRTVGGICKAHGASYDIVEHSAYPILINDAATNARYAKVFETLFGRKKTRAAEPVLGGEDFAFYAQMVPGSMFRLGIRNKSLGADKPWHSSKFIVDEEAIYYGTSLLAGATLSYLDESSR